MPSTFLGLNTGLSGLNYFQTALNTTAHNISNANTTGYSRQQVMVSASNPLDISAPYGMMGTGVSPNSVDRLRDSFYDNKYWGANSRYNKYIAEHDNLKQLQTYMNEITGDAGYTRWLSEISKTLQDIAANPSDYTTRISYTLTADSYTDMVNELANNFQRTQKTINDEIELGVSEINALAKQIFELGQQIINLELSGANANDLRDQRGVCIDKLSQYVDVDVEERSIMFGVGVDAVPSKGKSLTVRINGELLVDEIEYKQLMVVPRTQPVNQSDVDGLADIYWQCSDGSAGEEFRVTRNSGKLAGLIDVRDGNNAEAFQGEITARATNPSSVTVALEKSVHIDRLTIPSQGTITLNGREYLYDGWTAEYDADGNLNNFTFENMTMFNEKNVEVSALFPANIVGTVARIGSDNSTKGIPYYQAQLNEMVRTFSKNINDITSSGVDEKGNAGLDMFTALDAYGKDFDLKNAMKNPPGTVSSADTSYYRITALNWELNSEWKDDPGKVVVSYERDIEQGDIERRPLIDQIIFAMTDQNMFRQGTVAQFLQAATTNMAVDIKKMEVFSANQDDIRYAIDNQRKSVCGVDENEEAADLTKFENLYNLASKVISVLNEVYDKLINDTGV